MKRFFKKGKIYKIPLIILFMLFVLFTLWTYLPHRTMEEALDALESDASVTVVDEGKYIKVSPKEGSSKTGIILYPGARVDAEAYGVLAHRLAEKEISVYLVKMPYRIAFFGSNRADEILDKENLEHWYMMGHSLGGAVASQYAAEHDAIIDGLIFIGSYPIDGPNYKTADLKYLSIYASNDGFVTESDREKAEGQLPDVAQEVIIKGGNHEGFGYYGHQANDGQASISRDEQTEQVVSAVVDFTQ